MGQNVIAAFTCSDEVGGSLVASCVGTKPVGGKVDTTTAGTRTFTVTAVDVAGNGPCARTRIE